MRCLLKPLENPSILYTYQPRFFLLQEIPAVHCLRLSPLSLLLGVKHVDHLREAFVSAGHFDPLAWHQQLSSTSWRHRNLVIIFKKCSTLKCDCDVLICFNDALYVFIVASVSHCHRSSSFVLVIFSSPAPSPSSSFFWSVSSWLWSLSFSSSF